MKIEKLTDKYEFLQDGEDYILNLGKIVKGEDTSTDLLFSDTNKLVLNSTCGCTVLNKIDLGDNKVKYKIKYNNCDSSFSKVLNCSNGGKSFKIRIKGQCS